MRLSPLISASCSGFCRAWILPMPIDNFTTRPWFKIVDKKEEKDTLEGRDIIFPTYGEEGDRLNYIRNNIHYPKEAAESGTQGTIYLTFVITKEGEISKIEILRGVDPFLDYEAYRVVSGMKKWKPATLDGEPIEMQLNMPIRFILSN